MEKKHFGKEDMKSIVMASVIFVIGVLFCCSLTYGVRGLSFLIGFSLVVVGVLLVINVIAATKSLLNVNGLLGSALISFGVMFIVNRMASIIIGFIPWLLISVGGLLLVDAALRKLVRKEKTIDKTVAELVLGVVTLALGICLKAIAAFMEFAALILGAVLIVYALLTVFNTVAKKKNKKRAD